MLLPVSVRARSTLKVSLHPRKRPARARVVWAQLGPHHFHKHLARVQASLEQESFGRLRLLAALLRTLLAQAVLHPPRPVSQAQLS